ncbi:cilia- and flagella-associated protein 61-like [Nymphalis io]|uniref:cilia- and flagella-associated protein 61-like n=1 Tax=Inachis io TaxID=171585 RepID=UPI0021676CFE|nr:cilia- and flagella-associated protein 61-like [Nymphalis io]
MDMVSRILRATPLGRLRLALVEDAPVIMPFVTESMSKNFRVNQPSDIVYLIETCTLSICQLDLNESIVGFLVLKDYPLAPSVNPCAWEDFVWTKFKAIELKARNTLFIHMLCWNPVYAREVVDNMLKSVFMHDPYLQYIGMMKSLIDYQLLVPGQSRSEASFKRSQAIERGVPGDQLPSLWVAERREVSPRLRIRRAVEEDNDDLVPIIERHSTRLRELYGDFYISELISRHPDSERVLLVCEHKELAVGVMCLNTQINYEALEESFELSPFSGLRHLDRPPKPRERDSAISFFTGTGIVFESKQESSTDIHAKETKSRVTWVFEEDAFKDIHKEAEIKARSHQLPYTQLDILQLLEDEEDELEYDIVNIDTDLLRLPRLFMNEDFVKKQRFSENGQEFQHRKESVFENKYLVKDTPKRLSTPTSNAVAPCKPPEPTRYSGAPNAFLLELFAMHPDYDERYGFDMLEAAYELFPDKDYCVMCLPSSHTCFPLLEHFTLVTPYSFRMRFMNETLYIAHVNSIRGDIRVREAESYDIPNLNDVLEHAPRKQDLLALFETSLESDSLSSYIFLSQNQPVGLIVLGPLEDVTSIRTQYNLEAEPRSSGTDASILACIMSPIMDPHGRWYLRDVLRQTKYATLFWVCRLFAKGDASPSRNLMSLASHMLPVRPRRSMLNVVGNKGDKIVKDIATPFALWSLERPLTSLPKVHVNSSIVVVGASRTGLAFIETLLLGPTAEYLIFTNITLVSLHGLPTVADSMHAAETCVPRDGRYTDRYLKSLPFYYYVDVMSAVMIQIDRKKKCIHLKGGGMKFYDELVLVCGQQFQHPDYLKDSIELAKEVEKGKPCHRVLMDNPKYKPDYVPPSPDIPENVMLINSLYEANTCLRKLMWMISEFKNSICCLREDNQVVVYGDCIEAYSCIAALLELGLQPNNIAFIEPFPPEDTTMRVNCFNNETVDERVQASVEKLGVRIYRKCYLNGWSQQESRVQFLRLMTPLHAVHLPCFALFYFGIKAINLCAFKAINDCGLVYDGGLVVGPMFDTNDPHVFGAGSCAKYSRRLYALHHLHKYYCSEDVGEALAKLFLSKLDPFMTGSVDFDPLYSDLMSRYSSCLLACRSSHASIMSTRRSSSSPSKSRWQPVMKFESPIVQSATLPGPLHYMRLRRPGRDIPMAVKLLLPNQGHTLVTDTRQNYFRLQINALHCIESITCLSKRQFSCETLTQLYGKHEAYFNNLLGRFKMNLIDDLFEYFIQTWTAALYQEPFGVLLQDVNEQGGNTVYDVVKTKYEEFFGDRKPDIKLHHESLSDSASFRQLYCKECGQNEALRHESATFWKAIGGENIVYSHFVRYLNKNIITNPNYAVPRNEFI